MPICGAMEACDQGLLQLLQSASEQCRVAEDDRSWVRDELTATLKERIMFFDGGMGTLVQQQGLSEKDFRGKERPALVPQWQLKRPGDLR